VTRKNSAISASVKDLFRTAAAYSYAPWVLRYELGLPRLFVVCFLCIFRALA